MHNIVISLDAMGGAHAPLSVVRAAALAMKSCPNIYYNIHGVEDIVLPIIAKDADLVDSGRYSFFHSSSVVLDSDQPTKALRSGVASSMRKAINDVKDGVAAACVSAGNTGAYMVISKIVLGMLPGISRPAMIGVIPNRAGGSVLLDMGANIDCTAENLAQFAEMGSAYAKIVLGKNSPTIGILNVGSEEVKGLKIHKEVFEILRQSDLNFRGYVEGFDIASGTVDVIVTDGFSGNLVLKASEGVAKMCIDYLSIALKRNLITKLGALLVRPSIKKQFSIIDPKNATGAMLIGLNGIAVKAHGNSSAYTFANAIRQAYNLAKFKINEDIAAIILRQHDTSNAAQENLVQKIKKHLSFLTN